MSDDPTYDCRLRLNEKLGTKAAMLEHGLFQPFGHDKNDPPPSDAKKNNVVRYPLFVQDQPGYRPIFPSALRSMIT